MIEIVKDASIEAAGSCVKIGTSVSEFFVHESVNISIRNILISLKGIFINKILRLIICI